MKNVKKKGRIIIKFIVILIFLLAIISFYRKYNFNNFIKSVKEKNKTEFSRDSNVRCSNIDSYKIENFDYNDVIFYQTIKVKPNTPYKVSCKVKTKDLSTIDESKNGGAQISILNTNEHSRIIKSDLDYWKDLVFYFNSKNNEKLDVGFRLGGQDCKAKGTAWFSDFTIEEGKLIEDNIWNFACFIFPKIDVNVNIDGEEKHVILEMSKEDIEDIKINIERLKKEINKISHNNMQINYDIHIIEEPITSLSYDEKNGYFVAKKDVEKLIDSYITKNEYDHIYVCFRMADKQKGKDVLINDWLGLGGMDYYGIGLSNIRLPDDEDNIAFKYNDKCNRFPEEVFLHEFLHTLERNSKEFGYKIPALHDYKKFEYTVDKLYGQKKWYEDYMNMNIKYNDKKIGIPSEIYKYKPVHESNFEGSIKLNNFKEPENMKEILESLITRIERLF